ncbi:hypothetical protein ACFWBS_47640 [Streptomyces mirabilis]|uniref:hypothetical protein n=1 Tax=Streptomyces mirabilis TaxID=68239 RepID=UPI003658A5C8
MTSIGSLYQVAVDEKRSDTGLRHGRRRSRRSPQVLKRPVQGQLPFTIPEPEPESGALF